MYQIVTVYRTPVDVDAFERYFQDVHLPLAEKIPGVLRKSICRRAESLGGADVGIHLIVVMDFEDEAAARGALESESGRAAAADLDNFASAGRTVVLGPAVLAEQGRTH